MADSLRPLALKADAAVLSFLSQAEGDGRLWPDDISILNAAVSVLRRYEK